MRQRTLFLGLVGVMAFVLAAAVGRAATAHVQSSISHTQIVVAKEVIPAYSLITPDMLVMKEFPSEAITDYVYQDVAQLTGLVARVEILPDAPIYHSYAVPPEQVRYSTDTRSVLVSLRVDSARAVGGLIAPGHRVDIWRMAKGKLPGALDADAALALKGASVEMVAHDVRVIAVRSSENTTIQGPGAGASLMDGGQPTGTPTPTNPPNGPEPQPALRTEQNADVSILVVETTQELAPALIRLMGEQGSEYDLWLSLSPLERDAQALQFVRVHTQTSEPRDAATVIATSTPAATSTIAATPTQEPTLLPPTATPTATPSRSPSAVVKPGLTGSVNVRAGPGASYPIIARLTAGVRLEPIGRDESGGWLRVCCVAAQNDSAQDDAGWVSAELLVLDGLNSGQLPLLATAPQPPPTATAIPTQTVQLPVAEYSAQVDYRNEPGEKGLNYIRVYVQDSSGNKLEQAVAVTWPDGQVDCPGQIAPKPDGLCEYTLTEGEFTVSLPGERTQSVSISLPKNDAHTVATVIWRRSW